MLNAFCRVAPNVRFKDRAIFAAGVFFRASVFNSRMCAVVHSSLFDVFLAMEPPDKKPPLVACARAKEKPAGARSRLRDVWEKELGEKPPGSFGRELLALGIAYDRQERRYGGMRKASARDVDRLFRRTLADPAGAGRAPNLAMPGTILVPEWQGTTHHATVVADGFIWNGRSYSRLSAIARAITGTKWNGPRFFRLRKDDDRV